jgi:hypothetical protein
MRRKSKKDGVILGRRVHSLSFTSIIKPGTVPAMFITMLIITAYISGILLNVIIVIVELIQLNNVQNIAVAAATAGWELYVTKNTFKVKPTPIPKPPFKNPAPKPTIASLIIVGKVDSKSP